jgi:hypothetical protein
MFAATAILAFFTVSGLQAQSGQGFHHQPAVPSPNFDSLFHAAVPLEESADGRAALDSCLLAYGGVDHLAQLTSTRMTWRMKTLMSVDSLTVIKTTGGNRRYKIERQSASGAEHRIINGSLAWFESADTLIELSQSRLKAELFSYLVMNMPLTASQEQFSEIRYGHRAESQYHYFYMLKPDTMMLVMGVSPRDYFVHTTEGVIFQDENKIVFMNRFSHFKHHEGYVFPHAMSNVSMGLQVGQSVLRDVVVNPPLKDSDFRPSGLSSRLD